MPPQRNTTHGGVPIFFWWLSSVGTQHWKSFSTVLTTASSCLALASRNISRVSLLGSGPPYCGTALFLLPFCALRSHLADLAIVSSLGLNWNSICPRLAPGCRLVLPTGGSRRSSTACCSVGREPAPLVAGATAAAVNPFGEDIVCS